MGNVSTVRALAVYDGKLWAAGVGPEIWSFDGSDWALEKSGSWSVISDLVVFDGLLWATVTLPFPAGGEIWYYDGATWTVDESVAFPRTWFYFGIYDGALFCTLDDVHVFERVAGNWVSSFDAGGGSASKMATYDSKLWLARGPDAKVWSYDSVDWVQEYDGTDGSAWAIASYGGELWVGLDGTYQIFRYDGVDWVEQDFTDFQRVRGFGVAIGYLWIGTGYYARAYAWDGESYVLDTQPADANRDHDTFVFVEYAGDLYLGTDIDGRVYVRRTS